MKIESLEKLWIHELKDLWSAENQILEALPKMIDACSDAELQESFESHHKETKEHVSRLETIFSSLAFEPGGHRCAGMAGLIEEAEGVMKDAGTEAVRDSALVAAAQRIEHYEMAGYGTARAFAQKLGKHDAAELLQKTLDEEATADESLSRLAEKHLNFEAMV